MRSHTTPRLRHWLTAAILLLALCNIVPVFAAFT